METDTEDRPVPWWQRELNARLARRALRLEALRRTALRGLGGAALVAVGLLLVLVLSQGTRVRLAGGARRMHRGTALAAVPSPTRIATATATIGSLRARGATLTLDPPAAGRTSATRATELRVTLTDRSGAPLPGVAIWLTIDGALPYSGAATTDAQGVARFRYGGTAPYTVSIAATADGQGLARSTVRVASEPAVAVAALTGRFYASDDRCTYDTPPGTTPVLVARFPTINFQGRPFTDHAAAARGSEGPTSYVTERVGTGRLNHFDAAFTGALVVRRAGEVPFTLLIDDAFNFGIGGGAVRVRGTMSNPPPSGMTALQHLPMVGAFNQGHLEATTRVTVRFPRPGTYPFEIDYAECRGGGAALRVSAAGQFLPAVGS